MKIQDLLLSFAILVFAFLLQANAQEPFTNGLVAYYPFNGNANDESGNGRNGVFYNAPSLTADRHSIPNSAYSFNGTNTLIHAAATPINNVVNNFTMTAWFNPRRPAGNVRTSIIHASHGAAVWGDNSVGAGIIAGIDKVEVWEHSHDYNPIVLSTVGSFANWNMVCLVYSNKVPILYVNGQLRGTGNPSPRFGVRPSLGHVFDVQPYGDQIAGFGGVWRESQQAGDVFDGKVDDIRIYNRALSGFEVAQLYAYESGPRVNLIKAVKPSFSGLTITTNYQLQVSGDLNNWTNHGSPFTATNTSMIYPQYWDVDNWSQLFFRLQVFP